MSEEDLQQQFEGIRKGFRRTGREMVLSSRQALVRGIFVLIGAIISVAHATQDVKLLAGIWVALMGLIAAFETVMYLRLARKGSGKFVTGLERQLLKFLFVIVSIGGIVSLALVKHGHGETLPAVWMLAVGTAYISVGLFSFSDTWVLGLASCVGGAFALFLSMQHSFIILGFVLGVGSIVWSFVLRSRENTRE